MPFRPEQVEEECRAENGGYENTNEDIVGEDANDVVVLDRVHPSGLALQVFLLVVVI